MRGWAQVKKPAAPDVSGYTPAPITTTSSTSNVAGGEAQHLVEGHDIPGEWWTLFHSKPLNDLIERSLKANPDLKAAQAALIVGRENMLAQRGAYYPSVTGGFSATRAKSSADISPVTNTSALNYSLYTPEVSVSFVPDVFGLNRRTVESLQAQEQQARFALAATHITLSSNVAAGAIQEASLRGQVAATQELITINTDMLKILREQYAKGYASELDVAAQESQLAQGPANRGIVASTRTASAFCPGRDPYHAELKRRRWSHSRGLIAGPGRGDPGTHHHQYRHVEDPAGAVCEGICQRA